MQSTASIRRAPPPSFVTCPSVPLIVNMVENWMGNPGTSVLTIEKGSIDPLNGIFYPDPQFPTVSEMIYSEDGADKNLTSLFAFLSNYSGGLRITYQLPDDNCFGVLTLVVKTMAISVATAAFAADYKARSGELQHQCQQEQHFPIGDVLSKLLLVGREQAM